MKHTFFVECLCGFAKGLQGKNLYTSSKSTWVIHQHPLETHPRVKKGTLLKIWLWLGLCERGLKFSLGTVGARDFGESPALPDPVLPVSVRTLAVPVLPDGIQSPK